MRASSLLLASVAMLFAATAAAQGTSFTARVGRNPVGLGDSFPYEVTLSSDSARVENYQRPDFRGFRVIAERPSQSTQIQMGGGGSFMRQVYSWSYQLIPLQKGKLTIGPASARIDGKVVSTEKVSVTVVEAGQAPAPAQPRRQAGGIPGFPGSSFFFPGLDSEPEPESQPAPEPARAPSGNRNFLRVVPSKTKAYVGEQITVEWSLYLSERPNNYAPTKEPRTDGFWVEELDVPQNQRGLSLSQQTLDGRVYLAAPLMRKALFGLKPGKYTITPLEADISRVDFFGSTVSSEHLKAEPLAIEIVPLPPGAPAGFDPAAVGRLTLTAEVDRDQVQVGDAVTLKLRLEGQGNVRKIGLPVLSRLPGWKIYEPKVDVQMSRSDQIGGSKTAEYLLLPERPGQFEIAPFVLPYFDTRKAAYETARTQPLRLTVTGEALAQGPSPTPQVSTPGPSGSENLLAIDVRPLRNRPSLRRDFGSTLYRSPVLLGIVLAPPLLLGFVNLIGAARTRLGRETEGKRRRKLRRSANRRLRTATTLLHEGRLVPSLGEIERVLREFLSGKIGHTVAGMSRDELAGALAKMRARDELVQATLAVLEICDRARFAPGSITREEAGATIDRAGEIIEEFEKLPSASGGTP
jgi:hypothetical protein